jgi:hypothetical protein
MPCVVCSGLQCRYVRFLWTCSVAVCGLFGPAVSLCAVSVDLQCRCVSLFGPAVSQCVVWLCGPAVSLCAVCVDLQCRCVWFVWASNVSVCGFWELTDVLFVNKLIILKWHTLKMKYSSTLEQVVIQLRRYDSDTSDESIETDTTLLINYQALKI